MAKIHLQSIDEMFVGEEQIFVGQTVDNRDFYATFNGYELNVSIDNECVLHEEIDWKVADELSLSFFLDFAEIALWDSMDHFIAANKEVKNK